MTINTSFSIKSWCIEFHAFSNQERRHHDSHVNIDDESSGIATSTGILLVTAPLSSLFEGEPLRCFDDAVGMTARGALVALADYAARCLGRLLPLSDCGGEDQGNTGSRLQIKTMGQAKHSNAVSIKTLRRRKKMLR
jgi:hypothetical protein